MIAVSVILPTYNRAATLPRAIDSILAQTLRDIELVIVDDGSTDSTPEILQDYLRKDKRIKVIKQKNGGPSIARNTAVANASGKYIAFMDSDDACAINRLEVQMDFLEKHPQYSACACSELPAIDKYSPGIVADANYTHISYDTSPFHNKKWFYVLGPHSLMTKESFLMVGGHRSQPEIIGDLDFTLRYSKHNAGALIHNLGVYFYTFPSTTNKGEVNKNLLVYPQRHLACYISEWCRIHNRPDPVEQGKSLEEIMLILHDMPIADKIILYKSILYFTDFLKSFHGMTIRQGRQYLLCLLSKSWLERWLIDFKLKRFSHIRHILKVWIAKHWQRISAR